ncbi:MAG: HEPN domain-containing protein [Candidatus Aminicenantes bacterium]|nr:HEPN domain-containing protein [Candidatus Aminicenantes bacterium]
MGNNLSPELRKLLEDRKLTRFRKDRELVLKEIAAARSDLNDAKESLERNKFKWTTIQGYYSMFHSARALLFERGYREKSHYALLVAIRELYPDDIEHSLIREFEHGMYLRQEADYGLKFSESGALDVIETAEKLLKRAKAILKIK